MRSDQASHTAVVVAAGLQLLRYDPACQSLLPSDAAEQGTALLRAVRPRLARWLEFAGFRRACHWLEQAVMPGILLHYALRKRALMQHARASVRAGVTQVVVLGAGLDTISLRLLAEFPALHCMEVDHPATQALKRQALNAVGNAAGNAAGKAAGNVARNAAGNVARNAAGNVARNAAGNVARHEPGIATGATPSLATERLHYVSLDLAQQDLATALQACAGFDSARPTLFIAEGVLMYLREAEVAQLLRQLQTVAPQNWLALTWFDSAAGFEVQSRWLARWLALRNEPFMSGMPRNLLPRFLDRYDYAVLSCGESASQLAPAEVPLQARVLRGEYICLAQSPGWRDR